MNRWLGLGLLAIAVGALALRSPQLALRPMHNDEAVNAEKIKGLLQTGRYTYDPNEHHGPTLYYATLPFVWLSGARNYTDLTEVPLRAVSVFFGVALILLLWTVADGLGRPGTVAAAALTAVSPAMVFYSRYYIHEMLLVFATMLLLAAGWRYFQNPRTLWAGMAGAGLGLMYATKETFVLALAALAGALTFNLLWSRWKASDPRPLSAFWNTRHAALALAVAVVVSILFFTSFFTNAAGPLDSIRTYLPWLKRAGGDSPHIHPAQFYLERLAWFQEKKGPVWSELLILGLGVIGGIAAFRKRLPMGGQAAFLRFLTVYAFLLAAAYSLISYKTPWCLLGFWHPLILVAGVGATVIVGAVRRPAARLALALALVGAGAHLTWQAWRASYGPLVADRRNPYVYAQTVPDIYNLVQKVQALGAVHRDGRQMLIQVMAPDDDYWPLPWYLRQFSRVGWWGRLPPNPYAPVMIVGAQFQAALDEKSNKDWLMVGYFELRPKTFLELYVQFDLWQKYIASLPLPVDP